MVDEAVECHSDVYGDDFFCRSVLYPRGFPDGVFVPAQYLRFGPLDPQESAYGMSVTSAFLLRDDEAAIHVFGEKTALRANEGLAKADAPAVSDDNRIRYLGYYAFTRSDALSVPTELYRVALECRPDDYGEFEHFQLELTKNGPEGTSKSAYNRGKSQFRLALEQRLRGPVKWPSAELEVELPDLPAA